jgi:hypothetical protein
MGGAGGGDNAICDAVAELGPNVDGDRVFEAGSPWGGSTLLCVAFEGPAEAM